MREGGEERRERERERERRVWRGEEGRERGRRVGWSKVEGEGGGECFVSM